MASDPKRVLIVDDEPAVAGLLGETLLEAGHESWVTSDAVRAKEILGQQPPPDVMIADIMMPKISGFDLLAYAKSRCPQCRVILTTGSSKREFLAQALVLGAYDYVEKPFDIPALLELVRDALSPQANAALLPDRAAAAMALSLQARQASFESIRALARAVEAKDRYTRRHSEQVAHYATAIAEVINLGRSVIDSIRVAALLHDLGKIGIPDQILTKPGKLSNEEFDLMRTHARLGADILANITLFGSEARLVRHHHERWDGKGYPDGLAGQNIPLGARIIGIADAMDAMLMERTYKSSYPVAQMILEIARCAGTQFDPEIAVAAVRWCRANPDQLIVPGKSPVPEFLLT